MGRLRWLILFAFLCHFSVMAHAQQDRAKLVNDDLAKFDQDEYWIYNDLESGIAKAEATGKPMLVVFR